MAGVEASQIVIVVAFLALLVGVQVWVRRNREGLGARLRPGREVEILETFTTYKAPEAPVLRVFASAVAGVTR